MGCACVQVNAHYELCVFFSRPLGGFDTILTVWGDRQGDVRRCLFGNCKCNMYPEWSQDAPDRAGGVRIVRR